VVNRPGARGALWTDDGADRGRRSAAARSPEYGLRPLRCTKAHRRGRNRERRARGARLGPHRSSGDGGTEPEAAALGGSEARAWREAKRGWERCGEVWGWCSPFIGIGGAPGRGGQGLTPALMALTPLKTGGGGGVKGGIKGGDQGGVVTARRHSRRGAGRRGVAGERWWRGRARAARYEGRS
jgi:hypothetical protein